MHVEDLLEEAMFHGHTLGRNIAGTPETMMAMKRADILAYRDAYYVPSNTVIVLAGAVPANAMELLEKHFGKAKDRVLPAADTHFDYVVPSRPRVGRQFKPLKQAQLAFGFPTVGRDHKDQEAIKILATILGGTMSSRLFTEVRERHGLCYSIRALADVYDEVGTFVVRAGLDASRISLACDVILKELKKIATKGVSDDELQKAKDHISGGAKLKMEDSSERAEFVGMQELFLGRVETLEERLARFRAVKKADVNRVAKEILNFKNMSVATVGPFKNDAAILQHVKV